MRIILFLLLPTISFCQTFAVDSVYRNGIIHPHEEHEWVVSDTTLRDFDSELGFGEYWIVAPPKRGTHIETGTRSRREKSTD